MGYERLRSQVDLVGRWKLVNEGAFTTERRIKKGRNRFESFGVDENSFVCRFSLLSLLV